MQARLERAVQAAARTSGLLAALVALSRRAEAAWFFQRETRPEAGGEEAVAGRTLGGEYWATNRRRRRRIWLVFHACWEENAPVAEATRRPLTAEARSISSEEAAAATASLASRSSIIDSNVSKQVRRGTLVFSLHIASFQTGQEGSPERTDSSQ